MPTAAAISDVARLVRSGQLADAKRLTRKLIDYADPHDLEIIVRCTHVLETWPRIGVLKLRAYWRNANQHDRSIIEACVPENGEQRGHTEPSAARSPRWTKQNRYQAPRDVRTETRPEARRPASTRRVDRGSSVVEAYLRERAEMPEEAEGEESPVGYQLDYDRAALSPLHGTPCVRCWLERAAYDRRTGHDDGLCTECRDRGRPGITGLPPGHSRSDLIEARCAFITDTYPHIALRLLRRYWQQAGNDKDRAVVAAWVRDHHTAEDPALAVPAPRTPASTGDGVRCTSCGEPRSSRDTRHLNVDDGLCVDCRAVDHDTNEAPQLQTA